MAGSAARRLLLLLLPFLLLASLSSALYEDQVGIADWHQKYIGKVKHAVFQTQKTGRKRVIVATEENVVASLDLRRGEIFWRHVLGSNDSVSHVDIALGKYVVTLSSEGSVLRAWNLPDGQLIWESILQYSIPSKSILFLPTYTGIQKDGLIFVFGGGWLHCVSSIDGEVVWKKDFTDKSLVIQHIFQAPGSDVVYAAGSTGSSEFVLYEISVKSGGVSKHSTASYPTEISVETILVSNDMIMALDSSRSALVSVSFQAGVIRCHTTRLSNLVQGYSGSAVLLPFKFTGMFAVKTDSCIILVRVKGADDLEISEKIDLPATVSDAMSLSEGRHAFGTLQHVGDKIQIAVKLDNELLHEALKETVDVGSERGHAERIFINNYVRTDRSNGFRALIVMEDHSLLLVQQGEIVWSREDGLASIVDSTTSELPVQRDGVSIAKVEHNLLEWLKGHLLKVKGTLLLASPDDLAAIQSTRITNSGRNKMTRDHNGFRKLILVLTRAGKVLALHTGDGRIIWSLFLASLHRSTTCQNLSVLNMYQWQTPHHHAMDENPSILVVGRCGFGSDAPGVFFVVDSYTGKELYSKKLDHSIIQVIPLPLSDSTEQQLHLVIDANLDAHLYPNTPDSLNVFLREMSNIHWYSIENGKSIIRGHSLRSKCNLDIDDKYCFNTKQLWSVIFPPDSEQIVMTATRKINEVVHTQAKIVADQDLMYKYISKNMLFVATVAPKAAGEIGSVTPEEACLVAYLIDTITGRILHRVTHQGAQGPIHAVVSENWVVYHYFNLRAHRYEMSVIEIYDQSRADNKDIWKLILGKHNLTSPISSYSRPEVVVKSQSYFFTHSVRAMAVTTTAKGITSKQLLIGTIGDQVLALDKRYLDPHRSANPTAAEKEEGIVPLTDSLPIIPQSYVTHSHQVEGLRGILTVPAKLESTSLVFTYGVDLFFTRLAPSRTYDSLTEDFSYALLLLTIVALIAAIFITWVMSERKELKEKWR